MVYMIRMTISKVDYYFPYCKGGNFSTDAELEIIKQSDKESYQGFCDEMRLGVNLIFYLQNAIEYLQKSSMVMMEIVFADLI